MSKHNEYLYETDGAARAEYSAVMEAREQAKESEETAELKKRIAELKKEIERLSHTELDLLEDNAKRLISGEKMFALMKKTKRDGSGSGASIIALGLNEIELKEKWNKYVSQYFRPDKLPTFKEGETVCKMSYTGGGCFAEHTYFTEAWVDKI
jgi:uncharacterized small protein (DUF1192 family)